MEYFETSKNISQTEIFLKIIRITLKRPSHAHAFRTKYFRFNSRVHSYMSRRKMFFWKCICMIHGKYISRKAGMYGTIEWMIILMGMMWHKSRSRGMISMLKTHLTKSWVRLKLRLVQYWHVRCATNDSGALTSCDIVCISISVITLIAHLIFENIEGGVWRATTYASMFYIIFLNYILLTCTVEFIERHPTTLVILWFSIIFLYLKTGYFYQVSRNQGSRWAETHEYKTTSNTIICKLDSAR